MYQYTLQHTELIFICHISCASVFLSTRTYMCAWTYIHTCMSVYMHARVYVHTQCVLLCNRILYK